MKKIFLQNQTISYFDNDLDSDEAILFIHGNSHSFNSFRFQLSDPELNKFRLLAIDLPGHGDSSFSDNYSLPYFINIVEEFLQTLSIKNVVLVGHSLGGHIAIECLPRFSTQGILIFGAPPLSKPIDMNAFKKNDKFPLIGQDQLSLDETYSLIQQYYDNYQISSLELYEFNKADPRFRSLLQASLAKGELIDQLETFNDFTGPKAVISPTKDKLVSPHYLKEKVNKNNLFTQEIIEINSSHNVHVENFEEFNEHLIEFAKYCYQRETNVEDNFIIWKKEAEKLINRYE